MDNPSQIDIVFQILVLLGVWMYGKYMYNSYKDHNKD